MFLSSEHEMHEFGAKIYRLLNSGGVIFLKGNLGVGKTTLVRGVLKEAQIQQSIRSPTYTLMEHYDTDKMSVIHMDLYRLSEPEELEYLAVRDFINADTLFFIEWPEKAGNFFKTVDLVIAIEAVDSGRQISLEAFSEEGHKLMQSLKL